MSADRARALRHLVLSYLAVNAGVFALSRQAAERYGLHELIGALFLVGALYSIRRDDDDTARYGVRLGGIFPGREGDERSLVRTLWEALPSALREIAVAVAVAAVVFPVYAYFWPRFNPVPGSRRFVLDAARWRDILTNLFAVALTEEMYFRGYVQTRVADALGVLRRVPIPATLATPETGSAALSARSDLAEAPQATKGARGIEPARTGIVALVPMAMPVVITSALFALTHVLVKVTPARAAVFFPGLLFGAMRVWRGGIGAAVALHAMSNVFELWLEGQ